MYSMAELDAVGCLSKALCSREDSLSNIPFLIRLLVD
jgi:hypothetical protein